MTALETPSEILLMAFFADSARAEAAVESMWKRGFDPGCLSLLARDEAGPGGRETTPGAAWKRQRAVSPHLWFRFEKSAVLQLEGRGLVVALGDIAAELTEGPAARSDDPSLAIALRRLGLAARFVPRFEHALDAGLVALLARVARGEAQDWASLLETGGAKALTAHPRLDPWPRERPERRRARATPVRMDVLH